MMVKTPCGAAEKLNMDRRQFLQWSAMAMAAGNGMSQSEPAVIKLVYFHDYPPFSWKDDGDPVKGIFVDILAELFERRLKVDVHHTGLPWGRAQQLVRQGDADAMCTVLTPERESYCLAVDHPVMRVSMRLYSRKDHPRIDELRKVRSLDDLASFRLASYIGNGWAERNLGQFDVTWTRTLEQTMKMVALGRVDLSVDPEPVAAYFLRELGYTDRLELTGGGLELVEFKLLIRRNSPFVNRLAELNQTIAAMHLDGTVKKIQDAYLTS